MTATAGIVQQMGLVDALYPNVRQLSLFNGGNGQTAFAQTRGVNAFAGSGGTVVLSNAQRQFGTTSLYCPSGTFAQATSNSSYAMGSGDWEIAYWVYVVTTSGAQVQCDGRPGAEGAYPAIYGNGTNLLYYVSSANRITASGVLTTGWQYINVSRVSGTTRMFRGTSPNGTASQVGGDYTDGTNYVQMPIRLALGGFGTGPMAGAYFQNFRLTVGAARRSSSATSIDIPAAYFPDH